MSAVAGWPTDFRAWLERIAGIFTGASSSTNLMVFAWPRDATTPPAFGTPVIFLARQNGSSGADSRRMAVFHDFGAGDETTLHWALNDGVTQLSARTPDDSVPLNAWFVGGATALGNTIVEVYVNGTKATDSGSLNDIAISNLTRIGRTDRADPALDEAGDVPLEAICEISIWDVTGFSVTDRDDLEARVRTLSLAGGTEAPRAGTINADVGEPWTGQLRAWYPLPDPTDLRDYSGNGHHLYMRGRLSTWAGAAPPLEAVPAYPDPDELHAINIDSTWNENSTTIALTVGDQGVPAGSTIFVGLSSRPNEAGETPSITDDQSNTYTEDILGTGILHVWRASNVTALSPGDQITISDLSTNANGSRTVVAIYFEPGVLVNAGPVATPVVADGTSDSPSSGSYDPGQGNVLLLGALKVGGPSSGGSEATAVSEDAEFLTVARHVTVDAPTADRQVQLAVRRLTTAQSVVYSPSLESSDVWSAGIAAYALAGAPAASPLLLLRNYYGG